MGRPPTGIAVSPGGDHLYVINGGDRTVSVIKIESELTKVLNKRIFELIGPIDRGGGGWIILGGRLIPIPPRSPSVAVLARPAALHLDGAIDSPEIGSDCGAYRGATDEFGDRHRRDGRVPQCGGAASARCPDRHLERARRPPFLFRYPNAYVANYDGSVSVIRTSDNTVAEKIPDLGFASVVKVSKNGARAYVLRMQGVSVFDTAGNDIVDEIVHGTDPSYSLAIRPDHKTLYIVEHGNTLYVVDTATHATCAVTVGTEPADRRGQP